MKDGPFSTDFEREYELAKREGDRHFGSECKHEKVVQGRCAKCGREIFQPHTVDSGVGLIVYRSSAWLWWPCVRL